MTEADARLVAVLRELVDAAGRVLWDSDGTVSEASINALVPAWENARAAIEEATQGDPDELQESLEQALDMATEIGEPICPHCERPLTEIHKTSKGLIEQHTVYSCPHCHKVLSVGYNMWT